MHYGRDIMHTILLGVMGGVGTSQSPNSKTHRSTSIAIHRHALYSNCKQKCLKTKQKSKTFFSVLLTI